MIHVLVAALVVGIVILVVGSIAWVAMADHTHNTARRRATAEQSSTTREVEQSTSESRYQ